MGTSRRAEALALLGMAQRAGALVKGTDGARRALRRGEIDLLVLAEDASRVQLDKVLALARRRGVAWRWLGNRAELGAAVGSGVLTVVGVTEPGFARELEKRLGEE